MTAITVKQLRVILGAQDDHLPVYLQIDPEGNGFHQVQGIEAGMTNLEEHRPDAILPPSAGDEPEEWGIGEGEYKTNCVVIYP
jgi:hypothetical protein